jgi:hypothetical protein
VGSAVRNEGSVARLRGPRLTLAWAVVLGTIRGADPLLGAIAEGGGAAITERATRESETDAVEGMVTPCQGVRG